MTVGEFPFTSVLDTFTRSDAQTLGSSWGVVAGYSPLLGDSNVAAYNTYPAFQYYATEYAATQEAFATVRTTLATADDIIFLGLRLTTPTGTPDGYRVEFRQGGGDIDAYLVRESTSAEDATALDLGITAFTVGDKIGASINGSTVRAYYYDSTATTPTWTEVGSWTSADRIVSGYIGMGFSSAGGCGPVTLTPSATTIPISLFSGTETGSAIRTSAWNGRSVEFVIDTAVSRDNATLGASVGVGDFSDPYLTATFAAGTDYTLHREVESSAYHETIATTTETFGLKEGDVFVDAVTTVDFTGATGPAEWDEFYIRIDHSDVADVDTASVSGTWRVSVLPDGCTLTAVALADSFGGGANAAQRQEAIKADIYDIVDALSDLGANVHNRMRWAVLRDKMLDFSQDDTDDALRVCWVELGTMTTERMRFQDGSGSGGYLRNYTYKVSAWLGLKDEDDTEAEARDLAFQIIEALDGSANLHDGVNYYDCGEAQLDVFEPRLYYSNLCHAIVVSVVVNDWVD